MNKNLLIYTVLVFTAMQAQSCVKPVHDNSPVTRTDTIPAPEGWKYYGGDEFNTSTMDETKWFLYGKNGHPSKDYGRPTGMASTYRPEQIAMATSITGEKVVRITSERRDDGTFFIDSLEKKPRIGWWSGAFASREINVFYPLYFRMDVRAKVANEPGVWHGLWNRHFNGAGVGELDLFELFAAKNGKDVVTQSVHLWNSVTNTTDANIQRAVNKLPVVPGVSERFHVYSVQVDKDPDAPDEAIITYYVDDVVSYVFKTSSTPNHNRFITDAINTKRLNSVWDIAFTGQIGGNTSYVRYPDESVKKFETEIDYIRVYVKK